MWNERKTRFGSQKYQENLDVNFSVFFFLLENSDTNNVIES